MSKLKLEVSRDDAGRLLAGVRERKRKCKKGLDKFADEFDPVKGANLREGYDSAVRLERYLLGEINAYDQDHPREPAAHSDERQGRRTSAGLHHKGGR